jgi:hypothetical protein
MMFNLYVIETEGRAKAQKILREAEADHLYQQFKKSRPGLRQRIGGLLLIAGQKAVDIDKAQSLRGMKHLR